MIPLDRKKGKQGPEGAPMGNVTHWGSDIWVTYIFGGQNLACGSEKNATTARP